MRKLIPIIIIVSLLLSGCGFSGSIYANYRAIEELQTVQTLGLDRTGDGAVSLSAAAGASDADSEPLLLCRSGENLLEAMDALQDYTRRGQLFFAHTQFLVVGEAYAAEGIGPLLDYVERDMQLRTGTDLIVLRGAEAAALVTGAEGGDVTELLASVKRDAALRGGSRVTSLRETARALAEYGAALLCAVEPSPVEGSVFPEGEGFAAVPCGYAVLRGDRLAGYLTGNEAKAASLLLGYPGMQRRSVEMPGGGTAVLELDGAKVDVSPRPGADGAGNGIAVEAEVKCAVVELTSPLPETLDTAVLEALSEALSRTLEGEIAAVLLRAQALDADFLGLGGTLRRHGAALEDGWLQTLHYSVRVRATTDRSGDLDAPVETGGAHS